MKRAVTIAGFATAIAITGYIIYRVRKTIGVRMRESIAEEGYETASDILYPSQRLRGQNLQYGPVLPSDNK